MFFTSTVPAAVIESSFVLPAALLQLNACPVLSKVCAGKMPKRTEQQILKGGAPANLTTWCSCRLRYPQIAVLSSVLTGFAIKTRGILVYYLL